MTDRLYYLDPAAREFDATVVSVDRKDGRFLVKLDRSAFYPTSGGQPFDTGTLGNAAVIDVYDETDGPDGDVVHVLDADALEPGQLVHGRIDWTRRFDHMQQHTGQHVLSAAFDTLFKAGTVSFHMGAGVSTIDLEKVLSSDQIEAAETEANRLVWNDRSVLIRFVSSEEAASLPLRKPPKKSGTLRLIHVEGVDLSACGGTHVARTGEIGLIGIGGWERFKGGLRVEFVCGERALARFRSLRDTTAAAVRALSVTAAEVPQGIERLQEDAKDQRRLAVTLQADLARYRGAELAAQAEETPAGRLLAAAVSGDAGALKQLACAIAGHAGTTAVLVSTTTPALVVVARGADSNIRANELLGALMTTFGGKGGGRPELAQAGGLNGSPEEILSAARLLFTQTERR